MSLAENLLNSLDETAYQNTRIAGSGEEEHIKVGKDRVITVPNALKTIAVKGDKDVETATVDCVRYWDGHDLSTFAIYLNYILPNGDEGTYIPESITKSEDTFSFDWKIGSEFTYAQGKLTFWIVTKLTDDNGTLKKQWSSFQNSDCTIAQGSDKIYVPEKQTDQDVISHAISISRASAEIAEQQANLAKQAAVKAASDARDSAEAEVSRIIGELGVVQELGNSPNSVVSQAKVTKEFVNANDKINRNSKRLTNIELGLSPDPFETDASVAYVKYVPANALPFAEVGVVGGMTYKDEESGTLKSAKVTGLKSESANILPYPYLETTKTQSGITFTDNRDGSITANGTLTYSSAGFYLNRALKLSAGEYSFNSGSSEIVMIVYVRGSWYESAGNKKTFTLTDRAEATVYLQINGEGKTVSNIKLHPCINRGSVVLPYTPYIETTFFAIPEEVQAIDGYGEGVNADCYNYIDWEKKQYIQNVGAMDLGALAWEYRQGPNCFRAVYYSQPANVGNTMTGKEICGKYTTIPSEQITAEAADKTMAIGLNGMVYVIDRAYGSDAAVFKSAMAGVKLVYEYAKPVITDISSIISGDNFLAVEGNGAITFENENGLAVPSEVTYQLKGVTA